MVTLRYCLIFYLFSLISLLGQTLSPKEYNFQWQKANGDSFEIELKNNLSKQVEQRKLQVSEDTPVFSIVKELIYN